MSKLQFLSAFAGVCFGIWPLFFNRSGVQGHAASAVYTIGVLACLLPFSLGKLGYSFSSANWAMLAPACLIGSLGLLTFNNMLTKATQFEVAALFIIMVVVQTMVPALYDVFQNGITANKLIGFALAVGAIVFLNLEK